MYYIIFIGLPVPTKLNRGPIVTVGTRCDRPNRLSTNNNNNKKRIGNKLKKIEWYED